MQFEEEEIIINYVEDKSNFWHTMKETWQGRKGTGIKLGAKYFKWLPLFTRTKNFLLHP